MKAKIAYMGLALVLVFSMAAVVVPAAPVTGFTGNPSISSNWTTTTPTIDGNLSTFAGEWGDAATVTFGNATVYIKNDGTNLYMAAKVSDNTTDRGFFGCGGDFFVVVFDKENDGSLVDGSEDGMSLWPGIVGSPTSADYADNCWNTTSFMHTFCPSFPRVLADTCSISGLCTPAGTKDGQGDWTWDGENYYYEFEKPLYSGDAPDMAASPGDTIGVAMRYFNANGVGAPAFADWPTGLNSKDATTWGDLVLATPTEVAVDIKPTSCRNPLNVKSKGVLPVAILGTEDFDVNQVDPASVRLGTVSPLRWALEDVATPFEPYIGKEDAFDCTTDGPDGYLDLTLKFDRQELITKLGDVEDGDVLVIQLTGKLMEEYGGTPIVGEDVVVILKKGKN